jgi:disulfide oxidoreductase YuzD
MDKPDWKDAPDWANRIMKNKGTDELCWANYISYKYKFMHKGDTAHKFSSSKAVFSLVEMRPDPWAEGEERMENIVRNAGEGEHYDELLPTLDEFLGIEAIAIDPVMSVEGYDCLRDVLIRAYDQAAKGKGDERHAQGAAFEDQPMQKIIDLYGVGFALGQSAKKAQESMRLPKDRAIAELLGGINYLAGAIINMEKSK